MTGSEPAANLTRLRRHGVGGGLYIHYAGSSLTNSGTITVQVGGSFGVDEGAAFEGNEVIDENLPETQEDPAA